MKRFIIGLILILSPTLNSQNISPDVTTEKQRLLILPTSKGDDSESIDSKLAAILASTATRLGRFEVIDRNHLEKIMEEQSLQLSGAIKDEDIVELGNISASDEALIINVLNFGQKGVPPESEEEEDRKDRKEARKYGLLGIIVKEVVDAATDKATKDVERYPNNIQTSIRAEISKINIESGKSISSFAINIEHTGGTKSASLNRALSKASMQISRKLREMYLLTSEVLEVRGREVLLLLGKDLGLKKGTLFEIATPETKRNIRGREVNIPGRTVGLIEVSSISADANRGTILRRWEKIEPGYRAIESTKGVFGTGLQLVYGSGSQEMALLFSGFFSPLRRYGGNIQIGLGTITDSRNDIDFNLRFGGGIHYKLINTLPFSLAGVVTLPVNWVFRPDDQDHTVSSLLFSPAIGGQVEIMLGRKTDLIITASYCPSSTMSKWDYSKKDKDSEDFDSFPAEWDIGKGLVPEIDGAGFYITMGLRFLSF